jgi:hypothetical protein
VLLADWPGNKPCSTAQHAVDVVAFSRWLSG